MVPDQWKGEDEKNTIVLNEGNRRNPDMVTMPGFPDLRQNIVKYPTLEYLGLSFVRPHNEANQAGFIHYRGFLFATRGRDKSPTLFIII